MPSGAHEQRLAGPVSAAVQEARRVPQRDGPAAPLLQGLLHKGGQLRRRTAVSHQHYQQHASSACSHITNLF